jgi:hypothetical protein
VTAAERPPETRSHTYDELDSAFSTPATQKRTYVPPGTFLDRFSGLDRYRKRIASVSAV